MPGKIYCKGGLLSYMVSGGTGAFKGNVQWQITSAGEGFDSDQPHAMWILICFVRTTDGVPVQAIRFQGHTSSVVSMVAEEVLPFAKLPRVCRGAKVLPTRLRSIWQSSRTGLSFCCNPGLFQCVSNNEQKESNASAIRKQ